MIKWWLTERREGLGLSLKDVAHYTGLPVDALVQWSAGYGRPNNAEIARLAAVLADPNHPPGAWPISGTADVGDLVFAPGHTLGLGRLVELAGEVAYIEHLVALGCTRRESVPAHRVRRAMVSPETRCYVERGGAWRAGRVDKSLRDSIEVHFPDLESGYLPADTVQVRAAVPIPDPTETLALKAHDTAFFYRSRAPFAWAILQQRAAATLAGLASAAVHLFPHQVGVVRRVLEDPVRRYLLADEVGLGKTIEAGAVIRQTLLDDSTASVLVLVPGALVEQWEQELDEKFDAFAQPGRVYVLPYASVEEAVAAVSSTPFRLVVVDEAHHVAEWAWGEERDRFEAFARLAHAVPDLILLSATPAFHHEEEFLAMLHLLDPERYRLDNLRAFKERVAQRVNVGKALLGLSTSSSAIARRLSLRKVRGYFEHDAALQELAEGVEAAADDAALHDAVARLRDYVSETHRIYRRMLRTRRSAAAEALAVERAASRSAVVAEYSLDERLPLVEAELGVWRGRALEAAQSNAARDGAAEPRAEHPYTGVFRVLLETAGANLDLFARAARSRATGEAAPPDLSPSDADTLLTPPLFDGERPALEALARAAHGEPEETRLDLLAMVLEHETDRTVVFVSYPSVAQEVAATLSARFGPEAVGLVLESAPDLAAADVQRFREDPACRILVCDRSGEEGLNLQHAGLLVHYDLPFRPNRIEQRAGRLDRIGRTTPMRTHVLLDPEPVEEDDPESVWQGWYALLYEGFGVFESSIADLQFFAQRVMGEALEAALREGGEGLRRLCGDFRERAAAERADLAAQDALDAIDTAGGLGIADLEEHPRILQRAVVPWVRDALHFEEVASEKGVVTYRPRTGHGPRTLVPLDLLLNRFVPAALRPLAFDRATAVASARALPLRAGHPLFEALAAYADWDDRGRAFCVARSAPAGSPLEGRFVAAFQFDLVVEAEPGGKNGLDPVLLQRRADRFLPPHVMTVFVDVDGEVITDPDVLAVLGRSYKGRKDGGDDVNLHKERLEVLDSVVPPQEWAERSRSARDVAVRHVRQDPDVVDRLGRARTEVAEAVARVERAAAVWVFMGNAVPEVLDEEIWGVRVTAAAIEAPRVRVDAAGFWIVQ